VTTLHEGAGSHVPLARAEYAAGDKTVAAQQVMYFHNDVNGAPEELTDQQGHVVWRARYKAWGNVLTEEWDADYEYADERRHERRRQSLRFQGQFLDDETGLHYNTFRYYDPDIGRFISQDPIGLNGGLNLYQYASNAISWIDPWGWMPFWKPLKDTGMGHHTVPRLQANAHGLEKLGTKHDSPSWYPNDVANSDALHKDLHAAADAAGVPFKTVYEGDQASMIKKLDAAYKPFNQKGYLKIPSTGQVIAKNVTMRQALKKALSWSKEQAASATRCLTGGQK